MRKRLHHLSEENLSEEPLVNLTPLIDVVFVVLISFILIAPILSIDSVLLAPSRQELQKALPPTTNHSLAISIHADNGIWFQNKPITLQELEKALLSEKNKHPSDIPQLLPDARAHFQTYQQVKNTLEACGFTQVDIILKPS